MLKAYRLLAAGDNPEVELLQFLNRHGFPNTPALLGSYEHSGRLIDATLGILTRFVPAEYDGWTFALSSLAGDPSRFLETLDRLGEVTGSMHVALASDSSDPAFAAEEPSSESLRAARRDARRGDRDGLRASARATRWSLRSPGAGRRCASACGSFDDEPTAAG